MMSSNLFSGFIYRWTNLINDKKYIGQHFGDLDDGYVGSGVTFKRAVKKYKIENFSREILEFFELVSPAELDQAEKYWITYYDAVNSPEYYNLTEGGKGTKGHKHSDKSLNKMRKPRPHTRGIKRDPEVVAQIAAKNKGRKHPEETRAKMSKAQKARIRTNEELKAFSSSRCKSFKLVDPDGVLHEFRGIREFSRIHGLNDKSVGGLIRGKWPQYKGWTAAI